MSFQFLRFIYFIFGLGLCCFARAFSSHGEQASSSLAAPASQFSGFSCCRAGL